VHISVILSRLAILHAGGKYSTCRISIIVRLASQCLPACVRSHVGRQKLLSMPLCLCTSSSRQVSKRKIFHITKLDFSSHTVCVPFAQQDWRPQIPSLALNLINTFLSSSTWLLGLPNTLAFSPIPKQGHLLEFERALKEAIPRRDSHVLI
jgi:hypothetical protein